MLTQETQARLYGNEPWYPNYAENERESTIKWIKTLDSGDVEYTLHSWFEGDLYSKRKQIEMNAKDEKMRLRQSQVRQRKADPQIIEFSIIEELLKRFKKQ